MGDINERLVNLWGQDVSGRDVCSAMTDRLNGILSLEAAEETRPILEQLREHGFDHNKVAQLIGQQCQAAAATPDELPELEIVEDEVEV